MDARGRLQRFFHDTELTALHVASRIPLHRLRKGIVRAFGANIHPSATLYHGFEIRSAAQLQIGRRSIIGNDAILDARGGLSIGDDVNLSTGVHVWTGQHDWQAPDFRYQSAPVRIGDRAWISARVTILPGVNIGQQAVVAAGSVVTKDVASGSLVAGVPAKEIAKRPDMTYELEGCSKKAWWW